LNSFPDPALKETMMSKKSLSLAAIDDQAAIELPDRHLFAVAVGAGGLIGIGVAVDRTLNDVIDVNVEDNEICVNVAAVVAQAGCAQ
jgi:hypothetical protein